MPATTQSSAAVAYIRIGDQIFQFPSARLTLRNVDQQFSATIYSDDPPEAINDSYKGNSFYLETTPNTGGAPTIAGATWDFRTADKSLSDSISGIFLHGRSLRLQPMNVHILFDGDISPIRVVVKGDFLMFDNSDDRALGRVVAVEADFPARVIAPAKG